MHRVLSVHKINVNHGTYSYSSCIGQSEEVDVKDSLHVSSSLIPRIGTGSRAQVLE